MESKKTFNNLILIKLDAENDSIRLKNGYELYIDTTFDPEKHCTVTGEVFGVPSRLDYSGKPNLGMPWKTELEVKVGDHVICYYLAIINALKPENRRYVLEGEDRYVFIPYSSIFAKFGEGFVQPINGYCIIEPSDDPWWLETKERMAKLGLEAVRLNTKSNANVTFGIVRYTGIPNKDYVDEGNSDEGVEVIPGDKVVLRKISDIPLQYPLHAKIDGGKTFWRTQRRNILAKI
jgi:hypothetical protein